LSQARGSPMEHHFVAIVRSFDGETIDGLLKRLHTTLDHGKIRVAASVDTTGRDGAPWHAGCLIQRRLFPAP